MFDPFCRRDAIGELTALKNALNQKTISSFVVLRMPGEMEFYIALTPQRLREFGPPARKYSIEMNDPRATLLTNWVQQAKFTPRKYSPDCRWGLLFMDRNGKEVASIFSPISSDWKGMWMARISNSQTGVCSI